MTVVVADTSPLNYLALIGQTEILPRLFGIVLVPPEVIAELADIGAPPQEASRRGIPNTGTLGVIRTAALRQLVDLPTALTRLAATNFRVSQSLVEELLAEDSERKRQMDA